MGYRSEVLLAIAGPKKMMYAEFGALKLTGSKQTLECLEEMRLCKNGDNEFVLYLYGDSWKWYLDYEDVTEFMRIFHHFAQLSDEASADGREESFYGAFLRVGEDDNDIETRIFGLDYGDPWELGSISRSIHPYLSGVDVRHNEDLFDPPKTSTV